MADASSTQLHAVKVQSGDSDVDLDCLQSKCIAVLIDCYSVFYHTYLGSAVLVSVSPLETFTGTQKEKKTGMFERLFFLGKRYLFASVQSF